MAESNNVPKSFDINKQYAPIKTASQIEESRQASVAWRKLLKENPELWQNWYDKNVKRLDDPVYIEKLTIAINQFYIDNPEFNKEKAKDFKWQIAHAIGVRRYVESADYVNPKGMLGKHQTQETKDTISELNSGRICTKEHNLKVSKWRKENISHSKEIRGKISDTLTGTTHNRSKQVITTLTSGKRLVFDKIKQASEYFSVTDATIKNWVNKTTTTIGKKRVRDNLIAKGVELNEHGFPIGFEWGDVSDDWQKAKQVLANGRIFDNMHEAAEYHNITPQAMRARCMNVKNKKYEIKKEK